MSRKRLMYFKKKKEEKCFFSIIKDYFAIIPWIVHLRKICQSKYSDRIERGTNPSVIQNLYCFIKKMFNTSSPLRLKFIACKFLHPCMTLVCNLLSCISCSCHMAVGDHMAPMRQVSVAQISAIILDSGRVSNSMAISEIVMVSRTPWPCWWKGAVLTLAAGVYRWWGSNGSLKLELITFRVLIT